MSGGWAAVRGRSQARTRERSQCNVGSRAFRPEPRLDDLVASYLVIESLDGRPFHPRRVPDGGLDLVIDLDPTRPRAFVQGALVGPLGLREPGASGASGFLVAQLRPGAFTAWFGPAAADFVGRRVDATDAVGSPFRGLAERVAGEGADRRRIARLEAAIGAPRHGIDRRIPISLAALSHEGVPGAARATGMSPRGLRSLYERWIGVSPKTVERVLRFQRAAGALCSCASDRAGIALDAGYADQPHMAREVRALSGLSPTELITSTGRIHTH